MIKDITPGEGGLNKLFDRTSGGLARFEVSGVEGRAWVSLLSSMGRIFRAEALLFPDDVDLTGVYYKHTRSLARVAITTDIQPPYALPDVSTPEAARDVVYSIVGYFDNEARTEYDERSPSSSRIDLTNIYDLSLVDLAEDETEQ